MSETNSPSVVKSKKKPDYTIIMLTAVVSVVFGFYTGRYYESKYIRNNFLNGQNKRPNMQRISPNQTQENTNNFKGGIGRPTSN